MPAGRVGVAMWWVRGCGRADSAKRADVSVAVIAMGRPGQVQQRGMHGSWRVRVFYLCRGMHGLQGVWGGGCSPAVAVPPPSQTAKASLQASTSAQLAID